MTPRSDIRVDAVFDLETEDWVKPVFAGLYYSDGDYRVFDWKNLKDFYDHLFAIDGDVWAHYGGGFDIKMVLDEALRRNYNVKIAAAGSLIRSAKIRKLTLRDSFALFPASLADFTSGLGVSKEKLSLPCTCGDACGGYCSIKRSLPIHHARIKEYLRADCQSLYCALIAVKDWAATNDVDVKPTVGAAAWAYARRVFSVPDGSLVGDDFAFARSAYYGGRVEVFRWGKQTNVAEYDVRSMYPWALSATPLPWGNATRLKSAHDAFQAFGAGKPGAYDATVHVPYMRIPPLPIRTKKRIYYPTGSIRGVWTLPELAYAVECGCEVTAVHSALTWESTRIVFKAWADAIFDQRHHKSGGADSPLGIWNKFRANALTGKLGQNPERWTHEINPDRIVACTCGAHRFVGNAEYVCEVCMCPTDAPEHVLECHCNPHIELSPGIYKRRQFRVSGCMHPIWAAYLTSVSRVKLHRELTRFPDDACYCDTDSTFALRTHPTKEHPGLGDFEHKGTWKECFFAAPKVYTKDGKVKAKGIKGAKKLEEGVLYKARGVVGFGIGARTGTFFAVGSETAGRRLKFTQGGRILVDRNTGDTRPMSAEEAREDSRKR